MKRRMSALIIIITITEYDGIFKYTNHRKETTVDLHCLPHLIGRFWQ